MDLEQKLKKVVIRRVPSNEVLAEIEKGSKFIVVEENFDLNFTPQGYTLIDMRYKGDSFKALVPQSLLFYMANPGEGSADNALEEIADFYGEAENYEEDAIQNGETSVQEAHWATIARDRYDTYLINKLVRHKKTGEDGEPIPEFDDRILKELDLDDSYVGSRAKAIAALALGKSSDEIKGYGIENILKHVTVRQRKTEKLTREEFKKVACWAGSHYELRDECRNDPGVQYHIDRCHDKGRMVGTKTTSEVTYSYLDSKITGLEQEIKEYREKKHDSKTGRHDKALIRQYVNLSYIIPENPKAKLDVMPGEKKDE